VSRKTFQKTEQPAGGNRTINAEIVVGSSWKTRNGNQKTKTRSVELLKASLFEWMERRKTGLRSVSGRTCGRSDE